MATRTPTRPAINLPKIPPWSPRQARDHAEAQLAQRDAQLAKAHKALVELQAAQATLQAGVKKLERLLRRPA